jgi:hypothetical protein
MNYITASLFYFILKNHHHKKIPKRFQHPNNNSIEANWTLSLFLQIMTPWFNLEIAPTSADDGTEQHLHCTIISQCKCLIFS